MNSRKKSWVSDSCLISPRRPTRSELRKSIKNLPQDRPACLPGSSFKESMAILLSSLPVSNPHELRLIHWSGGGADFRPQYLGGRKGSSREPGQDSSGRLTADSVSLSVFRALREQCANHADIFAYSR